MKDFTKNDNICKACLNQIMDGGVGIDIINKFNYILDNAIVEELDTEIESNLYNFEENKLFDFKREYILDGSKVATTDVLVNEDTNEVETFRFNMKDVDGYINFNRDSASIYIRSLNSDKNNEEIIAKIKVDNDQFKCSIEQNKNIKSFYGEKPESIDSFIFSITKDGKSK